MEKKGKAILKPRREELGDKLLNNNIENAFLFDRTNEIKPDYTISDYEKAITEQSRNIIEADDKAKLYLEKIDELLEQIKSADNNNITT